MNWKDIVQRWRELPVAAKQEIRWRKIPQSVAESMAFAREPVSLAMLETEHSRLPMPRDSSMSQSGS